MDKHLRVNGILERSGGESEPAVLLRPQSTPDVVYEKLREEILSARLQAGEKIRQAEIADRFGFSRVPVREALRRLESEGLVVLRPQRGYIVATLDVAEIEEIFDIRMLLEERAGYLATLARTEKDVAEVERLWQEMEQLSVRSPDDLPVWSAYNQRFHDRLFGSSKRQHLCRVAGHMRDAVERYIRVDAARHGRIDAADVEHARILEAFRKGDAEAVGRLSREHCASTCAALVASLQEGKS